MKHIAITHKNIDVTDLPDWAVKTLQPIEKADFEQAILSNLGMPVSPVFFADQVVEGIRTIVAWDKHYASEVKAVTQ
jgi:hypothetical protein